MAALRFGFKILTYFVYAPLLNLIDALPLNAIYNFETASMVISLVSISPIASSGPQLPYSQ